MKNIRIISICMIFITAIVAFASCSPQKRAYSGLKPGEPEPVGSDRKLEPGKLEPGGKLELPAKSDTVGKNKLEKYNLYPAQVSYIGEQKWGYIDASGSFIIKPVFSNAFRFQPNGLAVAGRNSKFGLVDKKGRFIVEPAFNSIRDFKEGLAIAQDDEGFVVINESGHVISGKYPFISDYNSGRAYYYIGSQNGDILYGYLDETGKTIIEPVFKYAGTFEEDRAVVKLEENTYAIIDKKGKIIKKLQYYYVSDIQDGMIAYMPEQNNKYGYLDDDGNPAIAPSFTIAHAFEDGAAVVNASEDFTAIRYGLIDKKGRYLIKPRYNDLLQLGEGMAAIGIANDPDNIYAGSRYALATREGDVRSGFKFFGIEHYENSIASAYDRTKTFFIDKMGDRVGTLPLVEGTGVLEQLDNMVYADIDKRPYYMSEQGRIIYRPSNSITLKSGIKVSEEKFRPNRDYLVYYPVLSNMESLKAEEAVNAKLRTMWTDASVKPDDNLDYHYEGNFKIGFNRKNLLVLQKSAYDYPYGAAHGMPIMEYAHVDIKTGAFYRLEDLFKDGSMYTEALSKIVGEQIKEKGQEMGVWADSFKGIKGDQPFYITEDALVLYFTPYEIAPYAAGFPEFAVPYDEISAIINKRGEFWRSFNYGI